VDILDRIPSVGSQNPISFLCPKEGKVRALNRKPKLETERRIEGRAMKENKRWGLLYKTFYICNSYIVG